MRELSKLMLERRTFCPAEELCSDWRAEIQSKQYMEQQVGTRETFI